MAAALDDAHMQEGIARIFGKLYEAEALSGLYHLTVARTGGPEGLSNCGPRGGGYPKLRVGGS